MTLGRSRRGRLAAAALGGLVLAQAQACSSRSDAEHSSPARLAEPRAAAEGTEPAPSPAPAPRAEDPAPPAAAPSPDRPEPDFSSPEALFATLQVAVRDWNLELVFTCFGGDPADRAAFAEFSAEFSQAKDEIVACIAPARLSATKPSDRAGELYFALEGCPTKKGFSGTMAQRADGTWRIKGM